MAILAFPVKLAGCVSWICWLASYDAYDGWLDMVAILVGCLVILASLHGCKCWLANYVAAWLAMMSCWPSWVDC
jgi:hypothetical protein